MRDPARAVDGQRQHERRDREHEAQPDHQLERRRRRKALEEQIADGPRDGRPEREREADQCEIGTHRQRDGRESREAEGHPQRLSWRRALAQQQRREDDREQRLRLHDDRREAGRHTAGDAEELQQELAGEEREADRDQHRPRHRGPREHQGRHRGDDEAGRGELCGRQIVEADACGDEGESPDDDDQQCPGDVARTQRGCEPPAPCSRRTSSVCSPARGGARRMRGRAPSNDSGRPISV